MLRLVGIALFLTALACGSDEATRAVDVEGAPAPAAQEEPSAAPAAEQAEMDHPSVQSCLDLVRAGRFVEAVPPCTEAVQRAPGNKEVADALEEARKRAAQAAAEASEAAGAKAQELEEGLGEELP